MMEPPDHLNGFNLIAAISGSIASFALIPWKTMSKVDIALTFFLSFTFGLFIAPAIASYFLKIDFADAQIGAAITWTCSMLAHWIMPNLIRKAREKIGGSE